MTAPRSFDISECATVEEMASWLLRCPPESLQRDEFFIRRWLRTTGFREGLDYLEFTLSFFREERREDGQFMCLTAFQAANQSLWRLAEGLDRAGSGGRSCVQ